MQNKKPTIVLAIPTLQGSGAERVVINLATGFAKRNCDVHIILTLKNIIEFDFLSKGKFKIHFFNKYYRWIPRSIRGLILAPILDRFIVKNCGPPNLILSSLEPSDMILSNSKFNTYFIIQNHTSLEENFNLQRVKDIYKKKPAICCSKGVQEDFEKIFENNKGTQCIYNPIDINFITKKSIEFRPNFENYIVHIAKFKEQKRHDILIKSYHKSNVRNPLVLLGKGPLESKCKQLVEDLNLTNKVFFVGFQKNHYPFIKNAKLMLLSSDFEGMGIVILESLALKTPVISTDCPSGPSEVLPENNLVPIRDIDALSKKIIDATISPDKYISELSKEFYLENQVKKYLNLVE